jgi:hypothetical protein
MSTREQDERLGTLQGRLDLLILRTLIFGPQHGHGRGVQVMAGRVPAPSCERILSPEEINR